MLELVTVQRSREKKAAQVVHQGHKPVKPALSCLHLTLAEFVPFVLSVPHKQPQTCPYSSHFTSETWSFLSGHQSVSGWDQPVESLAVIKRRVRWIVRAVACRMLGQTVHVKNLLADSLNPLAEWTIT